MKELVLADLLCHETMELSFLEASTVSFMTDDDLFNCSSCCCATPSELLSNPDESVQSVSLSLHIPVYQPQWPVQQLEAGQSLLKKSVWKRQRRSRGKQRFTKIEIDINDNTYCRPNILRKRKRSNLKNENQIFFMEDHEGVVILRNGDQAEVLVPVLLQRKQ